MYSNDILIEPRVSVSYSGINLTQETPSPTRIAVLDSSFTQNAVIQDYFDLFNAGKVEGKWLTLNRIHVPEEFQCKGIGNNMMEFYLHEVDRLKFNVLVHVSPYPNMSLSRLIKFYQGFGFETIYRSDAHANALMYRNNK